MLSPDICACVTCGADLDRALAVRDLVTWYEVRIDLIGDGWEEVARVLPRPWIACNRIAAQGGRYEGDEQKRIATLWHAVELGAAVVDVEMTASDVDRIVAGLKKRVRVLISHHDFERTPDEESLLATVQAQQNLGADICKIVTMASRVEDTATVLRLVRRCRQLPVVAFAMGPLGIASRVLAPLSGALFTYASLAAGSEAAPGQWTVDALHAIYATIEAR